MVWFELSEHNKFTKGLSLKSVTEDNPYNSGDLLVEGETGKLVNQSGVHLETSLGVR